MGTGDTADGCIERVPDASLLSSWSDRSLDGTALLLIDVINDLASDDSDPLVEQAEAMAPRLAVLKRRAGKAGIPRSMSTTTSASGGRTFVRPWRTVPRDLHRAASFPPPSPDERLFRAQAEAFRLLRYDPRHIAGVARVPQGDLDRHCRHICVLFTANDAYMRDLRSLHLPIALCRTRQPRTITP